jgi:hypothetical protein
MSGSPLQLCHILSVDMVVKSLLAQAERGMLAARLIVVIAILCYAHSAEAIIPLNSEGGHSLGGRTQLLLFLDDLIPLLFGKPLLSR